MWKWFGLMAAMVCGVTMVGADEGLKKGERIVFLGDSITQAGAGPKGYVTIVKDALKSHHPELETEVIGAGISGNRVPDLEKRLDKDVIARKPSLVVIYIGINDVWHSQNGRGTPKAEFEKGLGSIIDRIQAGGGRVMLCTASVIGEKTDGSNKLDKMLDEYCDVSREVAKAKKVKLIDLRAAFLKHLKDANKDNKENGILTTDGVHLNDAGNKFVALQMLQGIVGLTDTAHAAHADSGHGNAAHDHHHQLRHVVLFKFKADVTPAQIKEVEKAFAELPKKIDTIKGFEWGTDVSVEQKAEGFTHCFIVTFADAKGREVYLPHAAHAEFVKLVGPRIDKVLVIDFFTGH